MQKIKSLIYVCLMFSSVSIASTQLPSPPEKVLSPYQAESTKKLSSAQELISFYKNRAYSLDTLQSTQKLPQIFTENLPHNLNTLSTHEKTSAFIRLLLPTLKLVNEQILDVRSQLVTLSTKSISDWSDKESNWVNTLYDSYGVKNKDINQLLLHIDIIPLGMALAQGIDESGWGTSYFAVAGNNLYGEHPPARGGKYLTTSNGKVKVAAFDGLYQATASYMHNLNSTRAYKDLWQLRSRLRAQNNLTGYELVSALSHYSTRGESYVENLQALIKYHQLDAFDHVDFKKESAINIRFMDK